MMYILLTISLWFTTIGDHYRSLQVLHFILPNREQVIQRDFLLMSNHYALNHKEKAQEYALRLKDSFDEVPLRYLHIAHAVLTNADRWREGDLADIGRDARISKERLRNYYTDRTTKLVQEQIVSKLDKLIKEKEEQAKPKPEPGVPNSKNRGAVRSSDPLPDSIVSNNILGRGTVDEKKLATLAKSWGTMPEKDRAKAITELTKDYPARYRVIIEDYFRALSVRK